MTLHISAIVGGGAYQVSDRLASVNGQPWDPTWNKTIVLRTMEALVTIGLTGPAFVGKRPIDEWMAEVLFDAEIESGTILASRQGGPLRRGLSASLASVERALHDAAVAGMFGSGDRVGMAVTGWRTQGGRVRVCAFALEWDRDSRPHFRRRTRRVHRFAGVGANPAAWVHPARLVALRKEIVRAASEVERVDLMIQLLREAANAGHPIGPDAMCVRIAGTHPVPRIRFAPATQSRGTFLDDESGTPYRAPAIYTPAIVTPTCAQLACVGTGPPFDNLDGFQIEWDLPPLPPPWARDGRTLVWRVEGQGRPPRP
jgi:hypothetical protein